MEGGPCSAHVIDKGNRFRDGVSCLKSAAEIAEAFLPGEIKLRTGGTDTLQNIITHRFLGVL